jgi:methionyl-tRNA synthetase
MDTNNIYTNQNTNTPFYMTTTIPYVNDKPHVGHALEFVQADVLKRHFDLEEHRVFLNIGTDEHGMKVYRNAKEAGEKPQAFADRYAKRFKQLASTQMLNIKYDRFIRTTDAHHTNAAQAFWRRCKENGDIYKDKKKIQYCVGCEMEKTDSDLNDDRRCPEHPDQDPEIIQEENYFFRFSAYQDDLLNLYESRDNFVLPEKRQNEIQRFIEDGLQDFSISRLKEKMPWGVPVPGDKSHVMYVWFDALVNYVSTLGWPGNQEQFDAFWPPIQFAGKDQVRQQAAMWQAMLLSAGLEPSRQIFIHGFITSEGQKMSKSLGNVIDPVDLLDKYGTDPVRYYLLRHVHPYEDSDMTDAKCKEAYNANLANGLGNLVQRIMTMMVKYDVEIALEPEADIYADEEWDQLRQALDTFRFDKALDIIFAEIGHLDEYIAAEEPYKLIDQDEKKAKEVVAYLGIRLYDIATVLQPFMPQTATRIRKCVQEGEVPDEPLFPRK